MQDGGVIPTSGFPRDGGTAKEGHRKDDSITVQNSSISFNTCIRSTAVVLGGYTFEACVFGAVRVRYDVEEVDVLGSSWEVVVHVATVVEVIVHGDGSCTRSFRRCPGSSVEVHVFRRGTWRTM